MTTTTDLIETYHVSWVYPDGTGQVAEWDIDMTHDQSKQVERRLTALGFLELYVGRSGQPVTFAAFRDELADLESDWTFENDEQGVL